MEQTRIIDALTAIEGITWYRTEEVNRIELSAGEELRIGVIHTAADASETEIILHEGSHLQLTELFTAEAFRRTRIKQIGKSTSDVTLLLLGSANMEFTTDLLAPHAESRLNALFLTAAGEHSVLSLRTNHMACDCTSNSLIKGVASGEGAKGHFNGLVYVAPDAQRTDARQTSRNIELTPGCRIQTLPQLEIYADDVKCSHGATVGQLDSEAILYMRQRGLSEKQARRLQIEGFAGDVVCHHCNEQLGECLCSLVSEKLQTM